MVLDVATASWLALVLFSIFLLIACGSAWLFLGFWDRMWTESLASRSVERRFLRWQHFAFRGHYPLGKWRKEGALQRARIGVFVSRAVLIVILVAWFIALGRRALVDLTDRGGETDQPTQIGKLCAFP